uniref:Uncharacterized protein n=1 Tax=Knipowitschia caucasica TaxID=637954 RepID=A0AAV2LGV0_KNICA
MDRRAADAPSAGCIVSGLISENVIKHGVVQCFPLVLAQTVPHIINGLRFGVCTGGGVKGRHTGTEDGKAGHGGNTSHGPNQHIRPKRPLMCTSESTLG